MTEFEIATVEDLINRGVLEKPLDGNHGGLHPKNSDYVDEGIPFIMASDIDRDRINFENCKYITREQASTLRKGFAKEGDVLLSHKATIGKTAVVENIPTDYIVLTPQVTYYRILDESILDRYYLHYYFKSPYFQSILNSWSGSGSTRAYISITEQRKLPILLPSIDVQKRITSILRSLDLKIELNLKMNKTLEEMAMTLYKHWFVDFGPFQDGEFVESELGMIPKGWKVIQVKDLGQVITGKTPSTKVKEYYGDKIPFIKIPDMHGNVYIVKTETMLSELGAQSQKNKMLPPNTVCVSCIATPGLVVLTSEMSQTNQQINSVVCKEGVSPYFVYLFFKSISDNIVTLGSGGTATLNLNKGDFSRIKLLMPTNEVMTGFNNKVEPIFNLIKINSQNNIELENLRDYLLPRLLSGEIDVSQAEKQVEEVL